MASGASTGALTVFKFATKNLVGILKSEPKIIIPSELRLDKLPPRLATAFNLSVNSYLAVNKNSEFNSPN